MSIRQVSIFIENQPGKLAEVTAFIAQQKINMRALSIADSQDFGIVRIICEDPDGAAAALKAADYVNTITEVFAVELADEAGSLAKVLEVMAAHGIQVEYTYAFLSTKKEGSAYMIFRVDRNAEAIEALNKSGIQTVGQADIF